MGKYRVICVGGCPSTGTTLLADLLDAVPAAACGPELNIFCIEAAYRFDASFRKEAAARKLFPLRSSLVRRSRFFNTRHLPALQLDEDSLIQWIRECRSLPEFVMRLAGHVASVRCPDMRAFAEKMPTNISCAAQFCSAFPDGVFVHLVRDGRSVVGSLRRRGYTLYESALIWLWETDVGRQAAGTNGIVEVRYEDLAADPFSEVAALAARSDLTAAPEQVESSFRFNKYRAGLDRVASWRAHRYSGDVLRSLDYRNELTADEVGLLESLVLRRPDGSSVAFGELLGHYGYEQSGETAIRGEQLLERHRAEYIAGSRNREIQKGFSLRLRT